MAEKVKREIISPEGVEERVELEVTFRLTMTGGGRYRCYVDIDGKLTPARVHASLEEAKRDLGKGMMLTGGMYCDPERTIDAIISGLRKEGEKP